MGSISETGHAKNVATFESLLSFVSGYGEGYNPPKASLAVPQLQALLASAQASLLAVNTAISAYSNAVAYRDEVYLPLTKLSTRILNFLKATDISPQNLENAISINRKIQGYRATPRKAEQPSDNPQEPTPKEISSSQLSFTNRLDFLSRLIQLLQTLPQYTPNEEELKLNTLNQLYTNLSEANTRVINATTQLSNARIERNNTLYSPNTGMVDVALSCKAYTKALYGSTSPQFKQISGLTFKAYKA
jgi:hypothetical protein